MPKDKVNRVEVGSFNMASPFYQKNLNDLKPFAILKVRLLDVYSLKNVTCEEVINFVLWSLLVFLYVNNIYILS